MMLGRLFGFFKGGGESDEEEEMVYEVTRAHLKRACDEKNWDLLDKLLALNDKHIDAANYYTDTWGEWWGLLYECVLNGEETGVRVLLKHGASRKVGNWGDCIPMTPLELAEERNNEAIAALLRSKERPVYERQTEPKVPKLRKVDRAVNRQGEVADETGMVFQSGNFEE
ncbi:MAG TPA: hypothetical protein VLL52_08930 [Anaerolineae bacterium]|nr:hypothetical protein [Anaerolineae bacterium]